MKEDEYIMKPIKEVATQLNVKVQSIEYHMKKLSAQYKYVNNKRFIDNTTIELIRQRMNISTDTTDTTEQTTDNANQSHTNTDNNATDNATDTSNNDTVNRLLSIIHDQQQTIDKLSSKQAQALLNSQVIQRDQLANGNTDDTTVTPHDTHDDSAPVDSVGGKDTHEDSRRGIFSRLFGR